ncbi:radical SAM family heme chaperone HemW [Ichthyobacterium seriolicida]|uniref:Heme chaperone HemW n=1 Tax=Ichthyobacterium seriolicida TaxID=242600 RepID=A0A1J1EAG2_9FLAO|nr:radical SAM family heme chaperone HemW [Ichthyobacterium seriolicida]BAV94496.1 oxygen-independent coproporphyrinogen III oxidase [Ichthyobacterium seriolicida]
MSSIYVHIPFCNQRCSYCNFYFSTSLKKSVDIVNSICKELDIKKHFLKNKELSTLYFGGGTPSLLDPKHIGKIINHIKKYFSFREDIEITLEANPDDLKKSKLREFQSMGINRMSIGIQSFSDLDLKYMNRIHSAKEAIASVRDSSDIGFKNINIDMIYGIPISSDSRWRDNLNIAFSLGISHISAYALTIEKKTDLYYFIKKGTYKNVDEQHQADQFEILVEEAKKNDFVHYEISNFSKENYFSKHNCNYWMRNDYLGLGPSAHSFDGENRNWNVSNNTRYIEEIEKGGIYRGEKLSKKEQFNEMVMLGIRTIWGVDIKYISSFFGEEYRLHLEKTANSFIKEDLLIIDKDTLLLTDKGRFLADGIASSLFL